MWWIIYEHLNQIIEFGLILWLDRMLCFDQTCLVTGLLGGRKIGGRLLQKIWRSKCEGKITSCGEIVWGKVERKGKGRSLHCTNHEGIPGYISAYP